MKLPLVSDATLQRRVLAATVVVILDTSIVNIALERIADAFTTEIAGLQWVVNAYTLAFASLLLTGGTLGDRLGARRIYLAGLAVFTLASALCGTANSLPVLTAARIVCSATIWVKAGDNQGACFDRAASRMIVAVDRCCNA